jgi:hypothetical protein
VNFVDGFIAFAHGDNDCLGCQAGLMRHLDVYTSTSVDMTCRGMW